jgi:hypothetical protein
MVLSFIRDIYWGLFRNFFLVKISSRMYKAKNIGVTFNYELSWGDHVSTVCRKVYGALARMRLIVAFVIPFFTYCDCVRTLHLTVIHWGNLRVRYVDRRRLFDHISAVSDSILGCFLLTYMIF